MARRLLLRGFEVTVWNRTQKKADALKQVWAALEHPAMCTLYDSSVSELVAALAALDPAVAASGAGAWCSARQTMASDEICGIDERTSCQFE